MISFGSKKTAPKKGKSPEAASDGSKSAKKSSHKVTKTAKNNAKSVTKANKKRVYEPSRFVAPLQGFSNKLLEDPRLKGTIITKAIKFIRYSEAANKIPEKELGIPRHIIFDDVFIKKSLKISSGKLSYVDYDMLNSLYHSIGEANMDRLIDKSWGRLDEINRVCQEAMRFRDFGEFFERGHDLNGLGASCGMLRLCAMGRAMEKASLAHDLERIQQLVIALPHVIDATHKAYEAWELTDHGEAE